MSNKPCVGKITLGKQERLISQLFRLLLLFQELMKKQDEGLDVLATSVARLGELSMGISDELGQQNKMLESMETDLETSAEELDIVTRKTKEFIKRAGGEKNCLLITSLSVVALILFFLVLYT